MDVRRAAVAEALTDHQRTGPWECRCGWSDRYQLHVHHVVDMVLAAADLATTLDALRRRTLVTLAASARARRAADRRRPSSS